MKSSLNLARSQRPQNFDEIVGQELAVRLVKNSLYRNQLFPVYLLAGQRGCGKTTLARVFAAAINCAQRENFTKNPKETLLPCQSCSSCIAMKQGSHPDFHEIDAASHTGVDNVRSLIDAATFLPGLGQKKIYLIDEAHMLSKAAFNAFLKIMEEPPATVTFMLATTDPQKIIETVRSRCFQLFFHPLPPQQLHDHLANICTNKQIQFESEALFLIAQEAEGSVRDALNRMEQIYLANGAITYKDTLAILGDISFEQLMQLCEFALHGNHTDLIKTLQAVNLKQYSATQVWKKTVDLMRALVWIKNGICEERFEPHKESIAALAQTIQHHHVLDVLTLLYQTEPLFNKTQAQDILLESMFMRMAPTLCTTSEEKKAVEAIKPPAHKIFSHQVTHTPKTTKPALTQPKPTPDIAQSAQKTEQPLEQAQQAPNQQQIIGQQTIETNSTAQATTPAATADLSPWSNFLSKVTTKDDPLVLSIFKQATFVKHESTTVLLELEEQHSFFKDLIEQTKITWQPLLQEVFGKEATIQLEFIPSKSTPQSKPEPKTAPVVSQPASAIKPAQKATASHQPAHSYARTQQQTQPKPIQRLDVRDKEHWKHVNIVLDIFPGTVTEEKEINHE